MAAEIAKSIVDLLIDPAFNEALSPAQGLQVTPHVFGSVEQEGRWKKMEWGYDGGRILTSPLIGPSSTKRGATSKSPPDVVSPPAGKPSGSGLLFSLTIREIDLPGALALGIAGAYITPLLGVPLAELLVLSSVPKENHAAVEIRWWDDGLEIWGGYAGLAPGVTGFGSVFGHRAKIDVTGFAYGNYLPARYMVVASGWINPVGPQFYEFRCGAVIRAGTSKPIPLFGDVWDRSGNKKELPRPGDAYGFTINNWANLTNVTELVG
jgi:hypothetical protein